MLEVDGQDALVEHICPHCGMKHSHKFQWDWGKFIVGKMGNKFLAWATYMVLQFILLLTGKLTEGVTVLLIVSASVTGLFMLAGAIDLAVSQAEIKANLSTGKGGMP